MQKLFLDDGLLPFREQFRAILKLRLALLVHQQAQTSQFSRVVAYAEEAGAILKSIFTPAPRQSFVPPPSPKVTRTQATRKVSAKAQPAASRLPAARARTRSAKTATVVPVTPRAKRGALPTSTRDLEFSLTPSVRSTTTKRRGDSCTGVRRPAVSLPGGSPCARGPSS